MAVKATKFKSHRQRAYLEWRFGGRAEEGGGDLPRGGAPVVKGEEAINQGGDQPREGKLEGTGCDSGEPTLGAVEGGVGGGVRGGKLEDIRKRRLKQMGEVIELLYGQAHTALSKKGARGRSTAHTLMTAMKMEAMLRGDAAFMAGEVGEDVRQVLGRALDKLPAEERERILTALEGEEVRDEG